MMEIFFDKLYRYDRIGEPCFIGIPVREGELWNTDSLRLYQEGKPVPVQARVTSRHRDGSVRFLFLRFLADLPGNEGAVLQCDLHGAEESAGPDGLAGSAQSAGNVRGARATAAENSGGVWPENASPVTVRADEEGIAVSTGWDGGKQNFSFRVKHGGGNIFEQVDAAGHVYESRQFAGPFLKDGEGEEYRMRIGSWRVAEAGPVCAVLKARGSNIPAGKEDGQPVEFELKLTAWAGKPWVEVSYRIINTTDQPLHVASLVFHLLRAGDGTDPEEIVPLNVGESRDCPGETPGQSDGIFHARGWGELQEAEAQTPVEEVRTCVGSSNFRTDFYLGRGGAAVSRVVDARWLLYESNEHMAEVFYGTFFADCTDAGGGVCATVFQAQQNYPKAVAADRSGLSVMLVPENVEKVVMQTGMSREQRFLLHFHEAGESLAKLDDRSLIYQMPDRPFLSPKVHRDSGVWPDVFADRWDTDVERCLVSRADGHCRAYGMLNFGDSYDAGYTAQGRGGGRLVWCNNEYDYPHACALLYVRTGIRRFLDYNIASCSHWMDVDVCHYHPEPEYIGGQWEHTGGHCINGEMVCSHQWVEGLLDYYHFTGDDRGLETALGIGENVLRLLDTPMYARVGEASARETGWALRTLTALYVETREERWISRCSRIVQDFKIWEEQYGNWLAPYTDNTVIRVGFMISVAIGSIMRYYREFPDPSLKEMMLRAVDDLIANCYVEKWGVFYYKELPSLSRPGTNTLLLEALAIAYELSGDAAYLKPGIVTFKRAIAEGAPGSGGGKRNVEDAVIVGNASSKNFAQSMIPLATYYRAASESGML